MKKKAKKIKSAYSLVDFTRSLVLVTVKHVEIGSDIARTRCRRISCTATPFLSADIPMMPLKPEPALTTEGRELVNGVRRDVARVSEASLISEDFGFLPHGIFPDSVADDIPFGLGYFAFGCKFVNNPCAIRLTKSAPLGNMLKRYPAFHMFLKQATLDSSVFGTTLGRCLNTYQCATAEIMPHVKPFEDFSNIGKLTGFDLPFSIVFYLLIHGQHVNEVHEILFSIFLFSRIASLVCQGNKPSILCEMEYPFHQGSLFKESLRSCVTYSKKLHNLRWGWLKEFVVTEVTTNGNIKSVGFIIPETVYEVSEMLYFDFICNHCHIEKQSPNTTLEMALELQNILYPMVKTSLINIPQSSRNCDAKIYLFSEWAKFLSLHFNICFDAYQRKIGANFTEQIYKILIINNITMSDIQIVVLNVVGSSPTGHPRKNLLLYTSHNRTYEEVFCLYIVYNQTLTYNIRPPPYMYIW